MRHLPARAMFLLLIATACVSCRQISEPGSVLTQHNDRRRTGVYAYETELTPASVSAKVGTTFGRLCVRRVEGQIVAQPLFLKGINGPDLLIVATRKNFVYAFDAAATSQNAPNNGLVWGPIHLTAGHGSLDAQPLEGMEDSPGKPGCYQTHGPVGITSTSVVDADSRRMYVVFRAAPTPTKTPFASSPNYGQASYILASIDATNGKEKGRTSIGAPESPVPFDPNAELNRPGLLLLKNPLTGTNVLYVAFGAPVCDGPRPSDGWVFAYSVPDLKLLDTYVTAPATHGAGIWQSGGGLAGASVGGAVYAATGNNADPVAIANDQTGDGNSRDDRYHPSRTDLGESILKLKLGPDDKFICASRYNGFCITDHFTAGNWFKLDTGYSSPFELSTALAKSDGDSDLGAGGPVLLPNGWVVAGGKQGRMYVLDPSHMHEAKQGFQFAYNTWHQHLGTIPCVLLFDIDKDGNRRVQDPIIHPNCNISPNEYDFSQAFGPNIHGAPVVWDNADPGFGLIYTMAEKDYLRAYRFFRRGDVVQVEEQAFKTTAGNSQSHPRGFTDLRSPDGMPGGALSLSANGNRDGILWVSVSPCPDTTNQIRAGTLMAFNAFDLKLLWFEDGTNPNWLCAPPQNVDPFTTPPVAFAKFVPPTIAGGKVFRATFGDSTTCPNQKDGDTWLSCGSVIFYGLRNLRLQDMSSDFSVRP